MKSFGSGFKLQTLGMRVCADLGPGLLGRQWSVQLIERERDQPLFERVAEIIEVHDTATELQCENISRLAGAIHVRGVSGLIGTEWIGDFGFVAVGDFSPSARSLASLVAEQAFTPIAEEDFWPFAAQLFHRISQFHRCGLVHGALSPATLKVDDGVLFVGELWWVEAFDGRPWNRSSETQLLNTLPESARRYAAPEVQRGEPTSEKSDYYSLGAILYFLMTGTNPPLNVSDRNPETTSPRPTQLDRDSEHGQFIFDLLRSDAGERTNRPQLENLLNSKMLSRIRMGFPDLLPFELTSEYGPRLCGVAPDQIVEILDLFKCFGPVQLGCRYEEIEAWFTIQGLMRSCGRTYLALSDSPDITEGLETIPFSVVCLVDDWHFRVLTRNEFLNVREDLTEHTNLGTGRNLDYAQFLLGPLRESF